jgi:hypothetical protein
MNARWTPKEHARPSTPEVTSRVSAPLRSSRSSPRGGLVTCASALRRRIRHNRWT